MMAIESVVEFARKHGYAGAEPEGKFNGFDAYRPVPKSEGAIIGYPYLILVKGDTIRFSTLEETFEYMDGAPPKN